MALITTLVQDIEKLIAEGEPTVGLPEFDEAAITAATAVGTALVKAATREEFEVRERWGSLWASEVGSPCTRKLYYKVSGTKPDPGTENGPKGRFLLGDIAEATVLFLARAAGHSVQGQQERVQAQYGDWTVVGKRDAIIDGVSVDVKSASPYSFAQYAREGLTPANDTYGYRYQSEFYRHYGAEATGLGSGILLADKSSLALKLEGVTIARDTFDNAIEEKIETLNVAHADPTRLPERIYAPTPPALAAPGVRTMHRACGLCEFKKTCTKGAKLEEAKDGRKKIVIYRTPPTGGWDDRDFRL